MNTVTTIRLGLVAIGLIVWGYGYRADDPLPRLIGIAFLAAAFLMRFWRRRSP